jgi:hypothetical protein
MKKLFSVISYKLLVISFLFLSLITHYSSLNAQGIVQKFNAFALTLDSLHTHVGYQDQYIVVYGGHALNDGFGGIFIYDSTSLATEIPNKVFKVTGKDTGRWIAVQIVSMGSDTSVYNNPDYAVINILTTPPGSPADGDKYLAGQTQTSGAAGAWIGLDTHIETWSSSGSVWNDATATQGQLLINGFNDDVLLFDGTNWDVITTTYIFHNKGDNFGPINLTIGNRRNKYFHFLTNNIDRGGFSNAGYLSLYFVRSGISTDSVAVFENGEIKRVARADYLSGVGTGTITGAGNLSPLFTTGVSGANITFSLSNAAAHTVLGNYTGSSAGPTYGNPTELELSTSDITTLNASTAKHGFLKKLNNDATYYMDGTGNWSIPSGGGGGSSFTRQSHTSGTTVTVTGGNYILKINPSSTLASVTVTLPASPSDMDIVKIEFGGTLTSGIIVTALTISPNSGQTILDNTPPSSALADDYLEYQYDSSLSKWYRRKP